jgi:hypothetical protein
VSGGYGRRHRELVLRTRPQAVGMLCSRCGNPMLAESDMELDHTDDRRGYRGYSHRACNRRHGGFKATGSAPSNPTPRSSTKW